MTPLDLDFVFNRKIQYVLDDKRRDKRKARIQPTAAEMKSLLLLLVLLYITQDVYAQPSQAVLSSRCSEKILEIISDDFFAALRKEESEGDICKMSAGKLGPYQISEEYYNDAVDYSETLKTGGSYS